MLTRHRAVALAVAAILTILAVIGIGRLSFNDQPQRLFESKEDVYDTLHALFDSFGTDDRDCLIVIEPHAGTVFEPEVAAFVLRLESELDAVAGVSRVTSWLDLVRGADRTDHEAILADPLIGGQLITPDARRTLVIAHLDPEVDGIDLIGPAVGQMRAAIDAARAELPPDVALRARITGIPPLRVDIIETLRHDQALFLVIGASLSMIVAWFIFRHLIAVAIVTITPIVGAGWSLGLMGWAGEEINVINAVMPTLVMVIGFTDAVHLMVDLRHSRSSGKTGIEAAHHAIRFLGPACAMTSFTTFVGFGSLLVASVTTIQRFGMACAAGVLLTFLAVIVVVPLASSYVKAGRLVDTARFARLEDRRRRRAQWIAPVLDHPRVATAVGILLTAALATVAAQLRPDNSLAETIPKHIEGAAALGVVDEHFGGILQVTIMVTPREPGPGSLRDPDVMAVLQQLHNVFDRSPQATGAVSLLSVLRRIPGEDTPEALAARTPLLHLAPQDALNRLWDAETGRLAVRACVPDAGAIILEQAFTHIEDDLTALREAHPGMRIELTGTTTIAVRNVRLMIGDLARSLGFASIVILIAVSIAFRSIRLGVISIVPNLFPLVSTAALLVVLGLPLQITSVIVFTVCLGIAVDDTIHFMARFVRERAGQSADGVRPAVERTFVRVGAALCITTVVLLCGFGAVSFSAVPAIRLYALLSCFAIGMALVGDLLILPAMLALFMKR